MDYTKNIENENKNHNQKQEPLSLKQLNCK